MGIKTAHELILALVDDWPEFKTAPDEHPEQGDEPVNGADLVDYMADFYQDALAYLARY